jgi:hypothetical protein
MSAPDELGRDLFFIVGHHRGGTTLLQAMLSSHSRITIPPETQFFLEIWPRRHRFEPLDDPRRREEAARFLCSRDASSRDLGLAPEEILRELAPAERGCEALFLALLRAWGRPRAKPRVGEKSPGHIARVALLARLYPHARFVCCLRDPRAVVASELGASWGARSADQIARRWRRVYDVHLALERSLPRERYLALRYESLVTDPATQLQRVCAFLGESFEPGMLDYHGRPESERGFDVSETWKQRTRQPLDAGRLEAWRGELTRVQIALVEAAVGDDALRDSDWPSAGERLPPLALRAAQLADRWLWLVEVVTGAARRKRGPRRARSGEVGAR